MCVGSAISFSVFSFSAPWATGALGTPAAGVAGWGALDQGVAFQCSFVNQHNAGLLSFSGVFLWTHYVGTAARNL